MDALSSSKDKHPNKSVDLITEPSNKRENFSVIVDLQQCRY